MHNKLTMIWNFESKDGDAYLLYSGMRAKSDRGIELGRIASIEPGNNADQLKVTKYFFNTK